MYNSHPSPPSPSPPLYSPPSPPLTQQIHCPFQPTVHVAHLTMFNDLHSMISTHRVQWSRLNNLHSPCSMISTQWSPLTVFNDLHSPCSMISTHRVQWSPLGDLHSPCSMISTHRVQWSRLSDLHSPCSMISTHRVQWSPLTVFNDLHSPCSMISTRLLRWGSIAHPIRMAICCTILMPVCLACQDFLLRHTALRKGSSDGMPRADATTANARAVVLRTYSSMLSMSGRIVEIIVARPAAWWQKTSVITLFWGFVLIEITTPHRQ